MKRLRRIIFNLLTGLSLLLCVATAVLWVRSCVVGDSIAYSRDVGEYRQHGFHLGWNSSWFVLGFGRTKRQRASPATGLSWSHFAPQSLSLDEIDASFGSMRPQIRMPGLRMRWTRRAVRPGDVIWTVRLIIQFWILLLLGAILPSLRLLAHRGTKKRLRMGLCPVCSYDLRATPDRCPECGTVPPKVKA